MQTRDDNIKRTTKRTGDVYPEAPERKRSTNDRNFEAPPPPRYDAALVGSRSG